MAQTAGRAKRRGRVWSFKKEEVPAWAGVELGGGAALHWRQLRRALTRGLPVCAICFACSMGTMAGGVQPMGPALTAAFLCVDESVLFAAMGATAGALAAGNVPAAAACASLLALYIAVKIAGVRLNDLSCTLACALSATLIPLAYAQTVFAVVTAVAGGLASTLLSRVYVTALRVRWRERTLLSPEELCCAALFAAGLAAGIRETQIFGVLPVLVLCFVSVLLSGYLGGVGAGTAVGAMYGVALGLCEPVQPWLLVGTAILGLFCGLFARGGRLAGVAALALGLVVCAAADEKWLAVESLLSAGFAALVFLFMPKAVLQPLRERLNRLEHAKAAAVDASNEARMQVCDRLNDYAALYARIAERAGGRPGGRQFTAISAALEHTARKLGTHACPRPDLALRVAEAFDREHLPALNVTAEMLPGDELRVTIRLRRPVLPVVHTRLAQAASVAMGRRLRVFGQPSPQAGVILLCPAPAFSVLAGCAQKEAAAKAPCGDCVLFRELPDELYMLALSDGMGHGAKAQAESRAAIELLEEYLMAGFEPDAAVTGVNELLLSREKGEKGDMYATMDLAFLDLVKGRLRMMKIGAVASYIKRGREVIPLSGCALPMGIVDALSPAQGETYVQDGDVLVMVSDGVADVLPGEEWLPAYLAELPVYDPETAANKILAHALLFADKPDDMSCIVARILKR